MSATDHLLLTRWERIARVFGRHHGVRVELTGGRCATDGGVIYLPANADHLKDEDQRVLEGLLDHEWLHVREEQLAREAKTVSPLAIVKRLRESKRVHEGTMFNVFEDVRIEAKGTAEYPGVAENLRRAAERSLARLSTRVAAGEVKDPLHIVGCGVYAKAKDLELEWMPARSRWILDTRLDELVREARAGISGPVRAERLAVEAVRRLRDLLPEVEEECARRGLPDSSAEETAKGGEGGTGEGTAEAPWLRSDGPGRSDAPKGDPTDERASGVVPGADVEALTDELLGEVREDLRRLLRRPTEEEPEAAPDPVFGGAAKCIEDAAKDDRISHRRWVPMPEIVKLDRVWRPKDQDRASYLADRARIGAQIRTLRAKLAAVLRARALDRLTCDQDRGVLDDSALYSLRLGNKRIFMQREKGHPIDTAVEVLVDLSGSMSAGARASSARLTAIALAEAMDALRIPFEVLGFHNRHEGPHAFTPDVSEWSRWLPFEYVLVKGWDEGLRACRGRFVALRPGEENVDGEAVLFAARRLARRNESKKVLFVLSDGDPAGGGRRDEMRGHLKETVARVTRAGIAVFGVGMQTRAVSAYYNAETGARHAVVNKMDELALEVFRLFKRHMLEEGDGAHDDGASRSSA